MLPIAILAGGYATRLGSLVEKTPKCMVEINGKPFVDWQLNLLIKNGYSDFVFLLSYQSEIVTKYLHDGRERGVSIKYSLDGETQLGTGGAIKNALPLLGNSFGVIYGDSYLPFDYKFAEEQFLNSNSEAMMTIYENQNHFDTSNVEFVGGTLVNYEKGTNNRNMQHIDYGLTFFRESSFRPWLDKSSFDLSDVCHRLATRGQLLGFEVFERFYEIGSTQGIEEFSQYLKETINEF
jgi:MurNAc alpha-1-phosphate uridylyltransferase